MGDKSIKRMTKKQKSLKNLKQFQNKVRFNFYVRFRPVAQKLFFPIVGLVLLAGIVHYEHNREYIFENPKVTVVEAIRSVSESSNTSSPATESIKENATMVKQPKTSGSSTVSKTSPVRASDVEAIKQVAEKEGIDWKVLMGICIKESNCNADRVGDSGNSHGAFQIHQKYHPGTIGCAKELKCSAEWTAKRLKRHEHLGEWKMIQSHNGLLASNANAYYVEDVKRIMETL